MLRPIFESLFFSVAEPDRDRIRPMGGSGRFGRYRAMILDKDREV